MSRQPTWASGSSAACYLLTRSRTSKCLHLPMYSAAYNYPSKPGCIGVLVLTMPNVISDTCILQLPSKSNIIQISQDTGRRGAARRIPVINPRLHPVPLHQARERRRAVEIGSRGLSRISEANTGTLGRHPGQHWGLQGNDSLVLLQ